MANFNDFKIRMDLMIDLQNVTYVYPDHTSALDEVTLRIDRGDSIALIGANGCGKSTLMRVINGLIFPDRGSYFFNGQKITERAMQNNRFAKQFHKQIGFVFQNADAQLFCASVREEIGFGPRQLALAEPEVAERVQETMALLGIETLADRPPYHLSGGEKKRVAIAAAVALNPDIYTFDEPMNNLDPKTKRFLRQFMIKLKEAGKTIICSTHDFAYVDGIFDRAAVFSTDHRLICDDDYNQVLADRRLLREQNII
jgi:cobalt/nickel transport system ATP-binding protein